MIKKICCIVNQLEKKYMIFYNNIHGEITNNSAIFFTMYFNLKQKMLCSRGY